MIMALVMMKIIRIILADAVLKIAVDILLEKDLGGE